MLLVNSFGQRLLETFVKRGQLCIGMDPSSDQLQKWGLPFSESGAEEFCNQIMGESEGHVGILKPQVAFFEQFGSKGFVVLERVLSRAKGMGYLVIADAKRGDIGTTMDGYAAGWLSSTAPFVVDALTVSPYLGAKSLEDTILLALENRKGIFLLAATSNSEAKGLQSSIGNGGQSVARSISSFAVEHNESHLGSIGVVVGAKIRLEEFGIAKQELENTPILAPGFGAQGAQLADGKTVFGGLSKNVIFNVSRAIAGDSPSGLRDRVLSAKRELEIGLSN